MPKTFENFEDTNTHIEEIYSLLPNDEKSITSGNARFNLCMIYKVVRPILMGLSGVLPKKWQLIIIALIAGCMLYALKQKLVVCDFLPEFQLESYCLPL